MKHKRTLLACLTLCLAFAFAACDYGDKPAESGTESTAPSPTEQTVEAPTEPVTEQPTDPITEPPSESGTEPLSEEPSDEPTETVTQSVIEKETYVTPHYPEKKNREDWDDDDPENPYDNLIPVGKSYDGKTTCYDGRYDFGYAVCQTHDGQYFYSFQEAVNHLEEMGGGHINVQADVNICLYLDIPDEGDYRLYYMFKNVDFVFDHGNVYDDCQPNAEKNDYIGYAYYSELDVLDNIGGLGATCIWMLDGDEFSGPGRYLLVDEYSEDPDYYYYYQYEMDKLMKEWPGLPAGEIPPEV